MWLIQQWFLVVRYPCSPSRVSKSVTLYPAGLWGFMGVPADFPGRPTGPFLVGFRSLREVLLSGLAGCLWAKSASGQICALIIHEVTRVRIKLGWDHRLSRGNLSSRNRTDRYENEVIYQGILPDARQVGTAPNVHVIRA